MARVASGLATEGDHLARMLEARSIAVVGASERPGSFGLRLATEALRSPSAPTVHLVHPQRREVLGRPCLPSLAEVPDPVDLVLLGVPDHALVDQLALSAGRGDGGAVVFGSAPGLGDDLVAAAGDLAVCGGGCMGFVNVARGVRAIGYLERESLPTGGIALVTHSGSVFSALLRTRRRLEFSLAVSSGQELVTSAADYLFYALAMPETRVVGLFLETLRDVPRFREALTQAAERDVPVVALTVGGSAAGRTLVEAHSGALAGDDAAWEALFATHGVHRVEGLDELVDTLETFAIGRRPARPVRPAAGETGPGIATVHDSGAERVLVADVAQQVGVPFAVIGESTTRRLSGLLAPGLKPTNPLDVWGTGADTAHLFTECLAALADDEGVGVVALAVDLVPEYDGDEAYPEAVEAVLTRTDKPVVVLSNLAAAVDQEAARRLRAQGVPVLEGTRSGLRTLAHLLAAAPRPAAAASAADSAAASGGLDERRRQRWADRLRVGRLNQETSLDLLTDYGVRTAATLSASSAATAVEAADRLGYPVVLKTDDPTVAHKLAAGGVVLGLGDRDGVTDAYRDLAGRLGPRVSVQRHVGPGVELCLGLVSDPLVGPLVLVAAGGTLVELLDQRRLGLPPLDDESVRSMLRGLPVARLLGAGDGAAIDAVVEAVLAVSQIALELGDLVAALDVNPLVVGPQGATAVDALVIPATDQRPAQGPSGA